MAATDISRRPRARRRRTIPTDQLPLALGGQYRPGICRLFIVTNIPTYDNSDDGELITDIEHWFRHRTDIEERIRDAKHGAALRHLPSGKPELNTVWMWALLAINISVLLQAVTGIDDHGRHGPRLRAELICIPARRIHHGRTITWRHRLANTCSHRSWPHPRTAHPGLTSRHTHTQQPGPRNPCPPERTSGTSACQTLLNTLCNTLHSRSDRSDTPPLLADLGQNLISDNLLSSVPTILLWDALLSVCSIATVSFVADHALLRENSSSDLSQTPIAGDWLVVSRRSVLSVQ